MHGRFLPVVAFLTVISCTALCPAAFADQDPGEQPQEADAERSPEQVLAAAGLIRSENYYVLADDAAEQRALAKKTLLTLKREYEKVQKQRTDHYAEIEAIREDIQQSVRLAFLLTREEKRHVEKKLESIERKKQQFMRDISEYLSAIQKIANYRSVSERYDQLSDDRQITQAIRAVSRKDKRTYKLGPTRDFKLFMKTNARVIDSCHLLPVEDNRVKIQLKQDPNEDYDPAFNLPKGNHELTLTISDDGVLNTITYEDAVTRNLIDPEDLPRTNASVGFGGEPFGAASWKFDGLISKIGQDIERVTFYILHKNLDDRDSMLSVRSFQDHFVELSEDGKYLVFYNPAGFE